MPQPSDLPRSRLHEVLEHLGPLVVRHDAHGDRSDRPVLGVVIDDRDLGAPLPPGSAVLGVGASDDDSVADLVARADAAGAAAVLVKHRTGRLARSGDPGATAVVEVAAELDWAQLHVFVRTALLHVGPARPGGQRTLFDVANAIALRVDGAVVIEDEHLRVVAYSSLGHEIDDARRATILGRQIPDRYVADLRREGITDHLARSPDPVRFDIEGPGMLPRLVVALRAEGRTIGLLWTITDDDHEAEARRVLADAAPDVAVELHRHLTADTRFATDRSAAARRLLEGQPVRGVGDLFGTPPTGGFVALLLRPEPTDADATEAISRTAQLAAVYIDAYRVPALVAPVAAPFVELVVGLTSSTTAARARGLLDELADRTRATFGIEVRGAMGTTVPEARDLPSSRRDAHAVLDLLAERDAATCAAYVEVQLEVAFRDLMQQAGGSEHVMRGAAVDLAASADRRDAAIAATVRAYLASGGDVTRTSSQLGVHRNTVRYRVQRFEELTGVDLTDPTQRLVTEVQLHLSS